MSEKSNCFGKCTLCGKEKKLSTVQLTLRKSYTLWLRRMCDDCRNKALWGFYYGLGFTEIPKGFANSFTEK